jgi:CRISPR/Cas system endoribonuclease Cas6 (RAMP superfamily)
MKAANDDFTIDMLAPPKRGAKRVLHPLTPAKRQAARRERLKQQGRGFLTAEVSNELLQALKLRSEATNEDQSKIVENILNAALLVSADREPVKSAQGAEAA